MFCAAVLLAPKVACADMLHILDAEKAANSGNDRAAHVSGSGAAYNGVFKYSVTPENPWDFNFSYERSSATFQWQVEVRVSNDPAAAGHAHREPPLKLFYYPDWPSKKRLSRLDGVVIRSPLLNQEQTFTVHMAPVKYATEVTARGDFVGYFDGQAKHSSLTYVLDIKVPGLMPLPRNDLLYKFSGVTPAHPDDHSGTSGTIVSLEHLAKTWKDAHPDAPLISIGNISLPWGGAFDMSADWKAPDMRHSLGLAADILKDGFTLTQRTELMRFMCHSGFYVYQRNEGGEDLFHIIDKTEFRALLAHGWPVSLPGKQDGSTNCCAAKPGSRDYLKCVNYKE